MLLLKNMSRQKMHILLVHDTSWLASYSYIIKLFSTNRRANCEVIQKVVSPEISKLNHFVMKKKKEDQIQCLP